MTTEDYPDGTGAFLELCYEHDGEVEGESVTALVANAEWSLYYALAMTNSGQYGPGSSDVYETDIGAISGMALSASGSILTVEGAVDMTLSSGSTQITATVDFRGPKIGTHEDIRHP